jgi:hypothetical protein
MRDSRCGEESLNFEKFSCPAPWLFLNFFYPANTSKEYPIFTLPDLDTFVNGKKIIGSWWLVVGISQVADWGIRNPEPTYHIRPSTHGQSPLKKR